MDYSEYLKSNNKGSYKWDVSTEILCRVWLLISKFFYQSSFYVFQFFTSLYSFPFLSWNSLSSCYTWPCIPLMPLGLLSIFFSVCLFVSSFYSLSFTFVIGKSLIIFCFSCIYFSHLSCTFMASTFLPIKSIFWLLKLFLILGLSPLSPEILSAHQTQWGQN